MKKLLLAAAFILSAITLTACSTIEGLGKDIQKAGGAIEKSTK